MHTPASNDSRPPPSLRGRVLADRYRVVAPLGQGGLGQVYVAEQIGLDRRVALKVMRPERKYDPVVAARFLREARAAGRINSPHVVTIYDCGRDGSDLYLAMELIDGETLAERLERGPMSLSEATRTGASIARGLRAAHEAGVLHRDLKPANVVLSEDGTVKVLDFGIAKLVDDSGEPLTAEHRIVGTPLYMSPEAVAGQELGPTADLYGLGLTLFEMLVGAPPFRTRELEATLQAHLEVPVPRLREAAPWLAVPHELDALVAALLDKDPMARPRDAGEVASRLDAITSSAVADPTVVAESPRRESRPSLPPAGPDTDERTTLWGPPAPSLAAEPPKVAPSSVARLEPAGLRTTTLAIMVGALVFAAVLLARLLAG